MKTAVLVDSSAYLSEELANHPDVFEIYLTINFANGDTIRDSSDPEDISAFYERLATETELPTTSQPTPGDYYKIMDEIVEQGYDSVIAIHLSKQISGTYQTSEMVLKEYSNRMKVVVIDSRAASVIIQQQVIQALAMIELEYSFEAITQHLHWVAEHSSVYIMVEDLKNLVTGGRLSSAGAIVGSVLQVRPIITFNEEGNLEVLERIRTNRRVYQRWAELLAEKMTDYPHGVHLLFAHADDLTGIQAVQQVIQNKVPGIEPSSVSNLGALIGTHLGKGAKAMGIVPKLDFEV